jgi:hypothetical protein
LELEDIENSFTSPMKTYKSGKFYIVRTNITPRLGKITLKIYDENERDVALEDIAENTAVMTILEVQGVKCSARNFQIEIELKQMMTLKPVDLFETCILRTGSAINNTQKLYENVTPEDLGNSNESPVLEKTINNDMNEEAEESKETQATPVNESESSTVATQEIVSETENIFPPPIENVESNELCEIDFNLDEMPESDIVKIKQRDDVYYEMYREARRKAKLAKDLALSAYLEAKQIKNKYMLDDISDSDDSSIDSDVSEDE